MDIFITAMKSLITATDSSYQANPGRSTFTRPLWLFITLFTIFAAVAGHAQTAEETEKIQESSNYAQALYPAWQDPSSPISAQVERCCSLLESVDSPVLKHPDRYVIVLRLAAKALGLTSLPEEADAKEFSEDPVLCVKQGLANVEKQHPDLYGLTSVFSQIFWENAARMRNDPQYGILWPTMNSVFTEEGMKLRAKRQQQQQASTQEAQRAQQTAYEAELENLYIESQARQQAAAEATQQQILDELRAARQQANSQNEEIQHQLRQQETNQYLLNRFGPGHFGN